MLLLAIVGTVLLLPAAGLVILLSGANSYPGRPVTERRAGEAIRRTDKVKAA